MVVSPVPFEPLKLIGLYFVRPLQIPYLVRSVFLPWWFHAEGALCSTGVWYSTVVTKHVSCVLHRPPRGSTRRDNNSSGSQGCSSSGCAWKEGLKCRLLYAKWFQVFQVTGIRGGKGINEGSLWSCVKDQSQAVIFDLDAQTVLRVEERS